MKWDVTWCCPAPLSRRTCPSCCAVTELQRTRIQPCSKRQPPAILGTATCPRVPAVLGLISRSAHKHLNQHFGNSIGGLGADHSHPAYQTLTIYRPPFVPGHLPR